jgi:D-3-phosphoglycerate dehydrogenase / 2-oxoglutarate reductase
MTKTINILFIDDVHPFLLENLENLSVNCVDGTSYSKGEIIKQIHQFEGIVVRSRIQLSEVILSKASNLLFIARAGAGMESIDVSYTEKNNIACFNSPEGNRNAVGEHALGMLLSLTNKLCTANAQVKKGIWDREENRGMEIDGKTIGIIGYGNMGSAFAKNLSGFDVNCIAYDKYKNNFSDNYVKEVSMNEVFETADILSLHVPLTEETKHLVNKNYLQQFKKEIILINTARGPILNTKDLVEALKTKKILAAALDVLEYEKSSFEKLGVENLPEEFDYLSKAENVILTPHVAGWTKESKKKHAEVLFEKIKEFLVLNKHL